MKVLLLSFVILVLLISLRFFFFFENYKSPASGDFISEPVTLLSSPKHQFSYQVFKLKNIAVEAPLYPEFKYGDRLHVGGYVKERFWTPSGSDRQISQLYIRNPQITVLPQQNPFIKGASFIRNRVYSQFLQILPHQEAVLLFGIVFGGSEGFSTEMEDAFKNTGVLHVVAASGMNVTMVSAFLLGSFSLVLKRRQALVVTICGVFYYALISGFEPSILRASIMISIVLIASILGRQNYGLISLLITAFIMLFINPLMVVNISFLLSFTSTLGILLVKPLFESIKLFSRFRFVTEDIATSLSAQIGSLPVVLGSFSSYSFISILVNALVLWTIPFLMLLGGIAAFCSIALPFVTFIPLFIALPFLWFFEKTVLFFGKVPLVTFEHISIMFFVGYYLLLVAGLLLIRKHTTK